MKKIRLSSASERTAAVAVAALLLLLVFWLCLAFRGDAAGLVTALICGALALILLGFYLKLVFSAACTVTPGSSVIQVSGIPSYSADVSDAVCVCTQEVKAGPVTSRSIVFTDSAGNTAATLITAFTARGGSMAEPAAMDIAELLGLRFVPSLEPWEYDPQARREKEAAERANKRGSGKAEDGSHDDADAPSVSDGGINYDAMDDLK